jgi:RNA-directed DNA polymerase
VSKHSIDVDGLFGKANVADSDAGRGGWKKRMLHCNDANTDWCLVTKVSPLPTGLPLPENSKNFIQGKTKMMILNEISASPDSAQWQSIDWKSVELRFYLPPDGRRATK